MTLGDYSEEVFAPTRRGGYGVSQRRMVASAAARFVAGKDVAFVEAGDDEDVQDRLCQGCPISAYCGAVAARLAVEYRNNDKMVPRKDHETLAARGVEVSTDGYEICSHDLIKSAVVGVRFGTLTSAGEDDPLHGAPEGLMAVDAVRLAVDDTLKSLQNGIRL